MITLLFFYIVNSQPVKDRPKTGCFPAVFFLVDLAIIKAICRAFGIDFDL